MDNVALQCAVLKLLSGRSFRKLSVLIAESLLLQWFCRFDNFNGAPKISTHNLWVLARIKAAELKLKNVA